MALHFCARVRTGIGEGVGEGVGVGVAEGVGVGFAADVVTTFTPLPHTFFFPWARQVYLKPFAIAVLPTLLQESPVFTAADADEIDKPTRRAALMINVRDFFMKKR